MKKLGPDGSPGLVLCAQVAFCAHLINSCDFVGRRVSYKTRREAASRECFSPCCVVEMRGSRTPCPNKPIDEYTTGVVDDFAYTSRTPIDRIRRRRPSGLKWWLEGGTHHSIPCFRRPVPTPQKKVGGTTHHWLLGSESVVVCRFGICCLSVV